MTDIVQIPVAAIDDTLFPRDRAALDQGALAELKLSIMRHGLRLPVELCELTEGDDGKTHGLISGFRRLTVFRGLLADGFGKYATIPALVRRLEGFSDGMRQMVEENDLHAEVAPWDKARIAVDAVPDLFPTIDAAVAGLYATADRQRRARIRAIAHVVEELGELLSEPATWSMRRLERLAAALRGGFTPLVIHALQHSRAKDPASQWKLLETILLEAESEARSPSPPDPRPGYPRRLLRPRPGLFVRREKTREGWCLHLTGKDATGMLVESLLDELVRWVGVE